MESRLAGAVALVTGASSGIGAATSRALVEAGANVVLAARRGDRLQALAVDLSAAGPGRAVAQPTDVAVESQIEGAVTRAIAEFGRIDILVNAAGLGAFGPIGKLRADDLDRLWAVNVRGAILAAKHVAPILAAQRSGAIVNIGSVSGKRGWAQGTPYVATKFALRGFTQCLFQEMRPRGVRVMLVSPNYTDTEFFAVSGVAFAEREKALAPEDVAATILFALELPPRADLFEVDLLPTALG